VSCGSEGGETHVPEGRSRRRRSTGTAVTAARSSPPAAERWQAEHQPQVVRAALDRELREALRRLLEQLGPRAPQAGDRPVVFEVEFEGLRCLVMLEPVVRAESMLSPREQQIARMVAQGYPNKTIAAKLGISSWTVSTHLRRMFAKFDVRSRAALVARLLEEELVLDDRRLFPR
jgi:DNA-binding CsgD family transcriptional regulator